jgi:phosphorylated CTD-interacting factor 1
MLLKLRSDVPLSHFAFNFNLRRCRVGVEAECFASPLNCRWRRYCSAHPDTDAPFGSLGSFFGFKPTEGSFECNPPFEEALVLRCARHINGLLDAAAAKVGRCRLTL